MKPEMSTGKYLFGQGQLPAARLEILADIFGPATRQLLGNLEIPGKRLAIDLGCGPGFVTHIIAETHACERVLGLDNAEQFISLATQRASPRIAFRQFDVTHIPLPEAPADLLFCRFLLTHLADPLKLIDGWTTQLSLDGVLAVQEVEAIETSDPALDEYLELLDSVLRAKSQTLYVGDLLPKLVLRPECQVVSDRVRPLAVVGSRAAAMFELNLRVWKSSDEARALATKRELDSLAHSLAKKAESKSAQRDIEWGLRELVIERHDV